VQTQIKHTPPLPRLLGGGRGSPFLDLKAGGGVACVLTIFCYFAIIFTYHTSDKNIQIFHKPNFANIFRKTQTPI